MGEIWKRRGSTRRRSLTTANPFTSIPTTLRRISAGASPGREEGVRQGIADFSYAIDSKKMHLAFINRGNAWSGKKISTRQSPTTTRPSASTPIRRSVRQRVMPGPKRRCTTRRSPTATMPSGSTRTMPWHTATEATLGPVSREFDKAIADYNDAIRLSPTYPLAYSNRGNAWSEKKKYDKAIADCNDAIRLHENSPWHTTTGATLGTAKEESTRRSPTTTRQYA